MFPPSLWVPPCCPPLWWVWSWLHSVFISPFPLFIFVSFLTPALLGSIHRRAPPLLLNGFSLSNCLFSPHSRSSGSVLPCTAVFLEPINELSGSPHRPFQSWNHVSPPRTIIITTIIIILRFHHHPSGSIIILRFHHHPPVPCPITLTHLLISAAFLIYCFHPCSRPPRSVCSLFIVGWAQRGRPVKGNF